MQTASPAGPCQLWLRVTAPNPDPLEGYVSCKAPATGDKKRLQPENFADQHSHPRQFYISQTPPEQGHIAAALNFDLCKSAGRFPRPGLGYHGQRRP